MLTDKKGMFGYSTSTYSKIMLFMLTTRRVVLYASPGRRWHADFSCVSFSCSDLMGATVGMQNVA